MSQEDTTEIILSAMPPSPKKLKRERNPVGLPQPEKHDDANDNYAEQVDLFSKLVMEKSERPLCWVWSQLDTADHLVIMQALGFFSAKIQARHYRWAREDLAELKRHTKKLKSFLKSRTEHEEIASRRPHFYVYCQYLAAPEGHLGALGKMLAVEVEHMEWSMTDINRILQKRSKWHPGGIMRAQEYVTRRADFLGLSKEVRLTIPAVADIYHLAKRTSQGGDDPDTVEKIQKSIANFRKKRENAYFVENVEFHIEDWRKPFSKSVIGNQVPVLKCT